MKIFPRRALPVKQAAQKEDTTADSEACMEPRVHRRIEITIERETVTLLVKGRPEAGAAEQAWERAGPNSEPTQLDGMIRPKATDSDKT
jgi:hypothetical protein